MKNLVLLTFTTLIFAASAHATCTSAALWAAETEYGNDPVRTRTKTVVVGEQYQVTVGIGNPEDGAHTYLVKFENGVCDPKTANVTEIEN